MLHLSWVVRKLKFQWDIKLWEEKRKEKGKEKRQKKKWKAKKTRFDLEKTDSIICFLVSFHSNCVAFPPNTGITGLQHRLCVIIFVRNIWQSIFSLFLWIASDVLMHFSLLKKLRLSLISIKSTFLNQMIWYFKKETRIKL